MTKKNLNDTTTSDIFDEHKNAAVSKEFQFKKQFVRFTILKNLPVSSFFIFSLFMMLSFFSEMLQHNIKEIQLSGVGFIVGFIIKQNFFTKVILFLNQASCFILTLIILNIYNSKIKIEELKGIIVRSLFAYKLLAISNFFGFFSISCITLNMFEVGTFQGVVIKENSRFDTAEWIFALVYIISNYIFVFALNRILIDNFLNLRTAKNSIFICFTIINLFLGAAITFLCICLIFTNGETNENSIYAKGSNLRYQTFLHSVLNFSLFSIVCLNQSSIMVLGPYFSKAIEEISSDISDNHEIVGNPVKLELNAF